MYKHEWNGVGWEVEIIRFRGLWLRIQGFRPVHPALIVFEEFGALRPEPVIQNATTDAITGASGQRLHSDHVDAALDGSTRLVSVVGGEAEAADADIAGDQRPDRVEVKSFAAQIFGYRLDGIAAEA